MTHERKMEIHNAVQAKLSDQEGFVIIYTCPTVHGCEITATTNLPAMSVPSLLLDAAHATTFGRMRCEYKLPPQESPDGG